MKPTMKLVALLALVAFIAGCSQLGIPTPSWTIAPSSTFPASAPD